MIEYLKEFEQQTNEVDLSIRSGEEGSYLTHSHKTQFQFVLQSLLLWRQIQFEMFRLWIAADADLLNPQTSYKLLNTGIFFFS